MVKSSIVRTLRNEDEEGKGEKKLLEDESVEKYRMNGKADGGKVILERHG